MAQQEFSPLRSRSARKPWPECPDITIYQCQKCSHILHSLSNSPPERAPDHCDTPMIQLEPLHLTDLPSDFGIDYKIIGGFNNSAVQLFWNIKNPQSKPDWILLKTFTGSYLKYIPEHKKSPAVFPLSDEDAYVYCDRDICEECLFRCKRGFIIYLFINKIGLVEIPLERMANYFHK